MKRFFPALFLLLLLPACTHIQWPDPVDSLTGKQASTEQRLTRAAEDALAAGKTKEAADIYAKLYTKAPHKKDLALAYGRSLRKTGEAARARDVLEPFAVDKSGKDKEDADPAVLSEYATANIELGRFDDAEKILNRILEDKKAEPFHAEAYNLMGIVLDAGGRHKEAEQMFRQSIEEEKGDKTSVMNNLALCLANQGMFDESLTTLRQALVIAPGKPEIARNIQIVSALREAIVPRAPVDLKRKSGQ